MPVPRLDEPILGYIVLSSRGGCLLAFLPGAGLKIIPPEDPEWGKRVGEVTQVFEAAHALVDAGNKAPAIRQKCHAMARELVATHEKELKQLMEASRTVHA